MRTSVTSLALLAVAGYVLWEIQGGSTLAAVIFSLSVVPLAEQLFPSRRRPLDIATLVGMAAPLTLGIEGTDRYGILLAAALMRFVPDLELRLLLAAVTAIVVASPRKEDLTYTIGCAVFMGILMAWLILRERDLARKLARLGKPPSLRLRTVLQMVIAAALGLGVAHGLPRLERWIIGLSMPDVLKSMSGFGRVTDLNSISSMQTSETIVMRVFSPVPRYLRGQISTKYTRGRWFAPPVQGEPVDVRAPLDSGTPVSHERIDSEVPDDRAVFLPLGASLTGSDGVPVRMDLEEIYSTMGTRAEHYSFAVPRGHRDLRMHQPREIYLQIPEDIAGLLERRAREWTSGLTSDHEKLTAIIRRFDQEFEYSLSPGSPGDQEPIQRFLEDTRKGHCEYFASAMVLIARAAGIPARFVAGYSVVEEHPWGGYYMGRQCDAHAWVEAWTPELGWFTYDPTPGAWRDEGEGHKTSWVDIAWDFLKLKARELRQALFRLAHQLIEHATGEGKWLTLTLLAGFLAHRSLRAWRRRKRSGPGAEGGGPGGDHRFDSVHEAAIALREAEDLLKDLLGFRRRASETPLEFLGRARGGGLPGVVGDLLETLIHEICRGLYGGGAAAVAERGSAGKLGRLLAGLREGIRPATTPEDGAP